MTLADASEPAGERPQVAGVPVALHFGDPGAEYAAARDGAALALRSWRAIIHVEGDDRQSFLQGLLSNDIAALAPGDGCRALLLDTKGHVLAALDVWARADRIVLGCDIDSVEAVVGNLRKYILAADVDIVDCRRSQAVLGLLGAAAEAVLIAAGAPHPNAATRAFEAGSMAGVELGVASAASPGAFGVELQVPLEAIGEVRTVLQDAAGDAAPGRLADLGWMASEVLRVEEGAPRSGHEILGAEFPQELGLDEAIDYQKGCYLGQETVARIHYRGQVNRLLRGVRLSSPAPTGAELLADGRSVGRITSAVESPRYGPIGLGLIRREQADAGTSLTVGAVGDDDPAPGDAGGVAEVGGAIVSTLPFGF